MLPLATGLPIGAKGLFLLTTLGLDTLGSLVREIAAFLVGIALVWVVLFAGLKSSLSSSEDSSMFSSLFLYEANALALGVLAEKLVVLFVSAGSADLN